MMRVKVILPSQVLLEGEAAKVVAEAEGGSFCLLPRHVDFVAALVPGILAVTDAAGREEFLAVDEGVLVKRGAEVLVAVRDAVRGPDLGGLREAVEERFRRLGRQERQARSALGRLEAQFVRQVMQWGERERV